MPPGVDILSRIAHAATRIVLGRDCVLASRSGDSASGSVRCYFDAKHVVALSEGEGQPEITDTAPLAIVDDTEAQTAIGRAPRARDRLTVSDGLDAGTYEITDVQPDGSGAYRCLLREVA